jgi:hypothetical protein
VQSAADFETIYAHLRRIYYRADTDDWDVDALKALALTAYASATREVIINSTSSEAGGAAAGEVKFNKMILLQAIEALLQNECGESLPPAEPTGTITNFGNRPVQF